MADISASANIFKKETFSSSKAMNVFLDNEMISLKEKFLEEELKNPRWNNETMKTLGATYKDEEEFNDSVKRPSYFMKSKDKDPGAGEIRIGDNLILR